MKGPLKNVVFSAKPYLHDTGDTPSAQSSAGSADRARHSNIALFAFSKQDDRPKEANMLGFFGNHRPKAGLVGSKITTPGTRIHRVPAGPDHGIRGHLRVIFPVPEP